MSNIKIGAKYTKAAPSTKVPREVVKIQSPQQTQHLFIKQGRQY